MGVRPSVLLVGDVIDDPQPFAPQSPFAQDMPTHREVAAIAGWLASAGYDVDVESQVRSFVDSRKRSPRGITFPLWRAGSSRNRTAIVPGVCEARDLPYVGGDVLVHAACQDKSLSKALIRAAGMKAPDDVVIRSVGDVAGFRFTSMLAPPVVVKPLYSACSIGVDDTSLCVSDEQVQARAYALFEAKLGPVICEEFIPGDEVCLCMLERHGRIVERCVAVYRDADGKCPFQHGLLTFDAKTRPDPGWAIGEDSALLDADTWERAERLLRSLEKVDLFRIDGRLHDGEFTVVELTPDIHLGTDSPFLGGFNAMGKRPADILDRLVQVSLANQFLDG